MSEHEAIKRWLEPRPADVGEVVGIGLGIELADDWLYVPGWVFARILGVARICGLHYLGAITYYEDTELEAVQCESLPEELEFVAQVLNDLHVPDVAAQVAGVASRCARQPGTTLRIVFD